MRVVRSCACHPVQPCSASRPAAVSAIARAAEVRTVQPDAARGHVCLSYRAASRSPELVQVSIYWLTFGQISAQPIQLAISRTSPCLREAKRQSPSKTQTASLAHIAELVRARWRQSEWWQPAASTKLQQPPGSSLTPRRSATHATRCASLTTCREALIEAAVLEVPGQRRVAARQAVGAATADGYVEQPVHAQSRTRSHKPARLLSQRMPACGSPCSSFSTPPTGKLSVLSPGEVCGRLQPPGEGPRWLQELCKQCAMQTSRQWRMEVQDSEPVLQLASKRCPVCLEVSDRSARC